jgi:DNA-binding NarL/FixJ family response regulator
LADRLAELLGGVSGLRLVGTDEPADVMLTSPDREPVAEAGLTTPRERQVLALLTEGLSNKTIARRLGISAHTIPAGHSCRAAAR